VVQRVAHVQGAGHVRRRNDDAIGSALGVGAAMKVAVLVPETQPALLSLAGIVLLGKFDGHWITYIRKAGCTATAPSSLSCGTRSLRDPPVRHMVPRALWFPISGSHGKAGQPGQLARHKP